MVGVKAIQSCEHTSIGPQNHEHNETPITYDWQKGSEFTGLSYRRYKSTKEDFKKYVFL